MFKGIPLPSSGRNLLEKVQNTKIANLQIDVDGLVGQSHDESQQENIDQSVRISGQMNLSMESLKGDLNVSMVFAKINNTWKVAFNLELPKNWKLGDMFPGLADKHVGTFDLPWGRLIFSNFDYVSTKAIKVRS